MYYVVSVLLLAVSLNATPLSDLVDGSPVVKAQVREVRSKAASVDSVHYKNPVMTIAVNDLPANSGFANRSLEAMQTTSIGLTQEIETFGKLGLREQIARIEYEIAVERLESERIGTAKELESLLLLHGNARERLILLNKRKEILGQLLKFEQSQVSEIPFAKVIDVQKKLLEIDDAIAILTQECIAYEDAFEGITGTPFQTWAITYADTTDAGLIRATPMAKTLELEQHKMQLLTKLEALKTHSDVILGVAYNHRQAWNDFFNVSLSFALPVYGTEEARAKAMTMRSDASGFRLEAFVIKAEKEIKTLQKRLERLQVNIQITRKLQSDLEGLLLYNSSMAGNARSIPKMLENTLALIDLDEQMIHYGLQRSQTRLALKYLTLEALQ